VTFAFTRYYWSDQIEEVKSVACDRFGREKKYVEDFDKKEFKRNMPHGIR
jgi:hypothetical protein